MGRRKRKQIKINFRDTVAVMDIGKAEIWDGADLCSIRETITRLETREKCRAIGVDMSFVKVIPSGFFGTLLDWHEKGVEINLYSPQSRVQNMLWFKKFCESVSENRFTMLKELLGNAAPYPNRPVIKNPLKVGTEYHQKMGRLPEVGSLA